MILCGMLDLCRIIFWIVVDLFRPRAALEAKILVLRQQITVLRRGRPSRLSFLILPSTRSFWVGSASCFRRPATHSPSFDPRRWSDGTVQVSDCFGAGSPGVVWGRPAVPTEIRQL